MSHGSAIKFVSDKDFPCSGVLTVDGVEMRGAYDLQIHCEVDRLPVVTVKLHATSLEFEGVANITTFTDREMAYVKGAK